VRDRSTYAIQAVENSLRILEAISEESGDFGINLLSKQLGLNKSYVFRILATFEKKGYVQQSSSSGQYRTGLAAYETGSRLLRQMTVLQNAKPIMENLSKKFGEAVYLAIPDGKELLFLDMFDSTHKIRIMSLVGKRFSLDQFSAGKLTLNHNTKRDDQDNSWKAISAKGAGIDYGAVDEGVGCLVVPVLNAQGVACARLCILLPEFRLRSYLIEEDLLPSLKKACEEVSTKLGYLKA